VPVPVDADSRLQPEALESLIQRAKQAGDLPLCVVATAGTTVTGSIDPLDACGAIARHHGLWFHVDASYGGALVFSPRYRDLLSGIEQADSVTFNPQKWLCIAKTCAMLLLRDGSELERHFRVGAPYMNQEDDLINLGEISVQGTRSADILKLWLTLHHFGQQGCAALVEQGFRLAQHLRWAIAQRPWLELAAPLQTNILCFRVREADDLQLEQFQRDLLRAGYALSLPRYQNQLWLKVVLVNPHTTVDRLDQLMMVLDQAVFAAGYRATESVC
jgi:glutamate/tyrosine decarboxylase-like PLP-dependent enzyme